jgi:FtsP/CotA-like multicopper oxidase with cupredoxin domain
MITRRHLLATGIAAGAGLVYARRANASQADKADGRWARSYAGDPEQPALEPGLPGRHYKPVITPSGGALPFRIVDGVKVFHLVAEEMWHEFAPGLKAKCWGYSGRVNATTIEAVEGDRVRIYVTNRLTAPTTVHWHGIYLPNGMDGVSGLTQRPIPPGGDVQVRNDPAPARHLHVPLPPTTP